jgi:ABC-type transport system involved in cytochrome c biogenesis permease subunit
MEKMAVYALEAGIAMTVLAFILYVAYAVSGVRAARLAAAGVPMSTGRVGLVSGPRTASIGHYATILGWLGFLLLGASLVFRTLATGHGPFSNMYEFSIAFAWGILGVYLWFEHKYHQRILGLVALPAALGLLLYAIYLANTEGASSVEPLVPALQNNLLLSVHVATAIVAYGSFTIAFAAALLFLAQPESGRWGLPKPAVLDEIGYRAIVIGFPFLTLTIVLGAVWADVAWGRYWGWDPKETASLVTWFIYGAYLHARVMRGWRGRKAAILLIIGFGATLLTYFGNLFFGGLHSYSGLG